MPVFVCDDHDYHFPVGVASVVRADDESAARVLLDAELLSRGLRPSGTSPYTLKRLPEHPIAVILRDGDY